VKEEEEEEEEDFAEFRPFAGRRWRRERTTNGSIKSESSGELDLSNSNLGTIRSLYSVTASPAEVGYEYERALRK